MIRFRVDDDEAGQRVDAVVAARTGSPRAAVQDALKSGDLLVSGAAVKPSHRVAEGDEVAGSLVGAAPGPPEAEDIPLAVRYSDPRVLVVSKPAGLVTHPAGGHPSGTLVNALLGLGQPLATTDPQRPGIVHRLDKDTSGLLLVAKDDAARERLMAAMKRREIRRGYLAIVLGRPPSASGTVDAPVGRHPRRRTRMAVVPEGRPAVTHYRVVAATHELAALEVTLETGRTHQIRVHLAHLGIPVLGDRAYGGATERARSLGATRPCLHAVRLTFPHPDDGRVIEVTDDLPADLVAVLAAAGLPPNGY